MGKDERDESWAQASNELIDAVRTALDEGMTPDEIRADVEMVLEGQ